MARSTLIALALLAVMVAALALPARQAWAASAGAFEVTGGDEGVAWSYETGTGPDGTNLLTVKDGAALTISMAAGATTSTSDVIAIAAGAHASITLDSVKISLDNFTDAPAIDATKGTLDVTLTGTNSIKGAGSETAVLVPEGSALTIAKASTGTLSIDAPGGAGIGGGYSVQSVGSISILGGTLNTTGGVGAGIGSSTGAGGGSIAISGGTVVANGYNSGLGGWTAEPGGSITITGGNVTANSQHAAAIGAMNQGPVGTITISGGTVKATTGSSAAGIGASYGSSSGGSITISGGDVTAQGESSPGIGSASRSPQGKIKITGGTVHAKAGTGAGIGAALDSTGDTDITISGGDVTATGSSGAGIGSGSSLSPVTISISDATVHADSNAGAGIGGGYGSTGDVDITISDSTIVATGNKGSGVGGWSAGYKGTVSITGGNVTATGNYGGAGIGGGFDGGAGTITISSATINAVGINGACGIGAGATGADDTASIVFKGAQVTARGSGFGAAIGLMPNLTDNKASASINITGGKIIAVGDENGGGGICSSSGGSTDGRIDISQSDVTSKGATSSAGIGGGAHSPAGNIQITESTVVSISDYGAGIGGGEQGGKGKIHITGGDVTAQGGTGAGIGGGADEPTDTGGTITLEQAIVKATGSDQQPGIGGGSNGPIGTIRSSGSRLTATGGSGAAGIGGGSSSTGGSISLIGGQVTATGGDNGAGIGDGAGSSGTNINIGGSTITANGGAGTGAGIGGAGIGGGAGSTGDVIVIRSGTVTATGGPHAPGIGSLARAGSNGKVSISNGSILAAPGDGSKAIDSDAISITGGIYGKGRSAKYPTIDLGRAYEWAPDQGYVALDNDDPATQGTYPIRIYRLKTYDLSGNAEIDKIYDGATPQTNLFALSDGDQDIPGFDDLVPSAVFRYREGGGGDWSDGLPKDAGSYTVESLVGVAKDDTDYIAYAPKEPFQTKLTIDRKPIEVSSATVESKDYDGKRDATVESVVFEGLVDGEALKTPADYTATGLFDDAEPGTSKSVLVTAELVSDGPVSKNYVMADGKGTARTTADIRPTGGDDDHGGSDDNGGNSNNGSGSNGGGSGASARTGRRGSGRGRGGLASTGDAADISSVVALAAGAGAIGLAAAFRRRTER